MSNTIDNIPDDFLPALTDLNGDVLILAELVGVRMALRISQLFDGTPARLYGHRHWLLRWRDQQIRDEYDRGSVSITSLARKFNLSDRYIFTILGKQGVAKANNK